MCTDVGERDCSFFFRVPTTCLRESVLLHMMLFTRSLRASSSSKTSLQTLPIAFVSSVAAGVLPPSCLLHTFASSFEGITTRDFHNPPMSTVPFPCTRANVGHPPRGLPCPRFFLRTQKGCLLLFTSFFSSLVASIYLRRITCSTQSSPNG